MVVTGLSALLWLQVSLDMFFLFSIKSGYKILHIATAYVYTPQVEVCVLYIGGETIKQASDG